MKLVESIEGGMTEQEERELNGRMLEFAEFRLVDRKNHLWLDPGDSVWTCPPDFPSDLTACFHPEWGIVRKLKETYRLSEVADLLTSWVRVITYYKCQGKEALTLCLAVRDLLDKEGK